MGLPHYRNFPGLDTLLSLLAGLAICRTLPSEILADQALKRLMGSKPTCLQKLTKKYRNLTELLERFC